MTPARSTKDTEDHMCQRIIIAAIVLAVACGGKPGGEDATVRQMGTPDEAMSARQVIDSSNAAFASALVAGDAPAMMTLYSDDAIVMPPGAPALRGRAEYTKWNDGMLAAFAFTDARFTTTDLTVQGPYAIETGSYAMTMKPPAGRAVPDTGKYLAIWKQQPGGGWRMVRDIFNSDRPPK
jgi:ketosteroid isomerase-like protein